MKAKAPHALCDKCPFKDRPFAKSVGPTDAKLAVVSRSPGRHEVLNGKCFSGPSGKVLDHLLELQGVKRDEVFLTNVVLCQSDSEDKGFGLAQACCEPRLEKELANAETVIAAGAEAAQALAGTGVASGRGAPHEIDGKRVIVTNNPAMVIRDDGAFPELVRDFKLAINPLPKPKLPKVRWTEDVEEARTWIPAIREQLVPGTLVAADIEGGYPNLACVGFATRPERAVVFGIPVVRALLRELGELLNIEGVRYLYQFGKYDVKELRRFGVAARVDEDTGLLSYALDERPGNPESGAGGHSLEWLLKDELGWPRYEPSSVWDFKKRRNEWAGWPNELPSKRTRIDLYEYNGKDTAGTLGLYPVLRDRAIIDDVYDRPYRSQLIPLSEALAQVELYGNLWDADAACDILEEEVWPKLWNWRQDLREMTHKPALNPNSHKQLGELMYEEWGLKHDLDRPKIERKGKRSVDAAVREQITLEEFSVRPNVNRKAVISFAEKLSLWKELDKQRGTYLEGLTLRRASDGRIYTTFKIHGTESGRLSSENPNMQNVTRPKEGLPNIRRVFIPDPGCQFVSADLSQAELRTIAVLSDDAALQAIYRDTGRSLHKEVAAQFYGDDYTYEQYVRAKNINFGVAYWQSAFSFAQMYHMPQEEAQNYIDFWWDRFPRVWEWTKEIEKEVLTSGVIQSPFGHKRRFYVIPQDYSGRLHIVKEGINFKPQNIAANITLHALIQLVDNLDPKLAQIRITVHDSIVANVRDEVVDETSIIMKQAMEAAAKEAIEWDFPYLADISVGPTWGDLIEMEIAA